jgi:hypothetical protein
MPIHTFGDSHAVDGWPGEVISHHLGPILCHSFGAEKLLRCDLRNFKILDGDVVIFCFGEIDCRCHVKKHITEGKTYKDVIDEIVKNYFDAIKANIAVLDKKLQTVCVYNVVPAVHKHNTWENPAYPFLGSDEERSQFVKYFNENVEAYCVNNEFVFINVHDHYADSDGFLCKELSDGNVHIADKEYMNSLCNDMFN